MVPRRQPDQAFFQESYLPIIASALLLIKTFSLEQNGELLWNMEVMKVIIRTFHRTDLHREVAYTGSSGTEQHEGGCFYVRAQFSGVG